MAEPTKEEIDGFVTCADLVTWIKMGNGLRDVLLAGLGCEATDSIRPIGNMPKDDFEAVVASLKPTADGAPTPFMVSSWKLFGRLSRLAVGAEYPEETGKPPAEDRAFLFHCFSAVEPSIEQVTAIQHLLKSSAPPYADFSVFGPHSTCMRKRMKLGGLLLAADGSLQKGELFGPSSFADWSKSYKVLATILLMLEQVWPEELDGYHELIKEYACRYGSKGWLTVYQADVRCRQEKMQIIRRRGVELWNTDQAAATRAGFNPDFPWRYVWSNAVLDASFWLREVQEKCILLITKSTSQDTVLEGDVLISGVGAPYRHRSEADTRFRGTGAQGGILPRHLNRVGKGKTKVASVVMNVGVNTTLARMVCSPQTGLGANFA